MNFALFEPILIEMVSVFGEPPENGYETEICIPGDDEFAKRTKISKIEKKKNALYKAKHLSG